MFQSRQDRSVTKLMLAVLAAFSFLTASVGYAADMHSSKPFSGAKVNGGTVIHSKEGGKSVLTLSDDFKVPETPDPHWQLVDSKGNVYLVQKLMVKPDKINKSIVVPSYVKDVAKVQIWCAFAETLLGEASFDKPVM